MKVEFDEQKQEWIELEKDSPRGIYLDGYLKKKLDNIKMIQRKDWDAFFGIDGVEGSGKSTLSFICGYYLSNTRLGMNNVAEGTQDAIKKIEILPDESVLIIDEGSLSLSSKDVFNKEQKRLIQIMNVMRQKKMVLIIVSPSFFDLNKYISVHRTRFLLHVYTDKKLNRGRFAYFSEKKKNILYEVGKKKHNSYSYPPSDFVGVFTNFIPTWYSRYLELKKRTLMIALKMAGKNGEPILDLTKEQRMIMLKSMQKHGISATNEQKSLLLGVSDR